jgi:putative membrane protein
MPTAHAHIETWSLPIPVTLALVVLAALYLRHWLRLRASPKEVFPAWRLAAFMAGILSIWIAVASPMSMLDHELLTFHMVKHLMLMIVASPLILLGAPWLMRGGRPSSVRRLGWTLLLASATVVGWHIPAAFELALQSHAWHGVEDASFLAAGLFFWWPVIASRRGDAGAWSIPLYLFLATLPCDILSAFLAFCGRVIYPAYLVAPGHFQISPVDDQQLAGALMWVSVTLVYLVPAAMITMQILSPKRAPVHQATP